MGCSSGSARHRESQYEDLITDKHGCSSGLLAVALWLVSSFRDACRFSVNQKHKENADTYIHVWLPYACTYPVLHIYHDEKGAGRVKGHGRMLGTSTWHAALVNQLREAVKVDAGIVPVAGTAQRRRSACAVGVVSLTTRGG